MSVIFQSITELPMVADPKKCKLYAQQLNYANLRQRMLERLRQLSPLHIDEITLPHRSKRFTQIYANNS